MKIQRCFLDMDGVLVNWVGGIHKALGLDYNHDRWPYEKGPEGWHFHNQIGYSFEECNEYCGREFWADLGWMPGGRDILRTVFNHFTIDQITLLTSPMPNPGSASGKMDWMRRNLPGFVHRIGIWADKKSILAQVPNSILVDDCDRNVDQWREAGGEAFLVPQWWNTNWYLMDYTTVLLDAFIKEASGGDSHGDGTSDR